MHSTFRTAPGRRNRLRVRPLINFRALETPVSEALPSGYTLTIQGDRYEINAGPDLPILRLAVEGAEGPTLRPMAAHAASASMTSRRSAVTIHEAGYGAQATFQERSAGIAR